MADAPNPVLPNGRRFSSVVNKPPFSVTTFFPTLAYKMPVSATFVPIPTLPRRPLSNFSRPPFCSIGTRTLGVDYGLRRIGLAVSVGIAPRPLPRVQHDNDPTEAAAAVARVADATLSQKIVVGLPINTHGVEGVQAEETRDFIQKLIKIAPWATISTIDERFSTMEATDRLRNQGLSRIQRKNVLDSTAAAVVLERVFSGREETQLVHEGVRQQERSKPDCNTEKIIGFAEWRKQAMNRAKLNVEDEKRKQR